MALQLAAEGKSLSHGEQIYAKEGFTDLKIGIQSAGKVGRTWLDPGSLVEGPPVLNFEAFFWATLLTF